MQALGSSTHRIRQRRAVRGIIISLVGLIAIFILLYLIGHLPTA